MFNNPYIIGPRQLCLADISVANVVLAAGNDRSSHGRGRRTSLGDPRITGFLGRGRFARSSCFTDLLADRGRFVRNSCSFAPPVVRTPNLDLVHHTQQKLVALPQRRSSLPGGEHGATNRTTPAGARRQTPRTEDVIAESLHRLGENETKTDAAIELLGEGSRFGLNDVVHLESGRGENRRDRDRHDLIAAANVWGIIYKGAKENCRSVLMFSPTELGPNLDVFQTKDLQIVQTNRPRFTHSHSSSARVQRKNTRIETILLILSIV